jgi:hypothetical protein
MGLGIRLTLTFLLSRLTMWRIASVAWHGGSLSAKKSWK